MDIKEALLKDKVVLPDSVFENIARYKEHLFRWNKIHNLTGAKSEALIDDFIYDALYPISFLAPKKEIMDIGTGAGFPGMILAIALRDTHVTLVEPLKKRASFLQFIKADLALDNVTVEAKRVEELAPKIMDLITSRAVTQTQMLTELSRPFSAKGTQLLFYKGEKVFDEVEIDNTTDYKIIQTQQRHYLLIET